MIAAEMRGPILDLLAEAALRLDSDDLENWVECFEETASYHILSRENVARDLPLPLFRCDNKGMLRDRVLSLRKANVTNPHRDCHIAGLPRLSLADDGTVAAESSYALYQTDHEGMSRLFSLGTYRDRIRVTDGRAKFINRTVIVEMFSVPTMLSTPI
jgi:anthranilate 1,2-dioxygenase small subunit